MASTAETGKQFSTRNAKAKFVAALNKAQLATATQRRQQKVYREQVYKEQNINSATKI